MSLSVDIHKRLGDFTLDVTFSATEGTMGLLGASGSGKSLTLTSIAGIVKPDAGRIVLNGRVLFDSERHIDLPPQQRRVGYLFQNYALFPNMTVEQNVACGLHREKDRRLKDRAVKEMLSAMRLTGLEKHRPAQLSGGQQQRVALARILVGQPDMLMLDEPTSALDSFLAEQLRAELAAILRRFGKDALLVTHAHDEAYALCRSLAVLDNGSVVRTGDTKAVFADPASRRAAELTGCRNIVTAERFGETGVYIPAWGVTLETGRPVGEGLYAVGVHAHRFSAQEAQNRFPVRVEAIGETPSEWNIQFHYASQPGDAPPLTCRMPKTGDTPPCPAELGVAPADVLLLYA